jgi:hypothetical protein
MNYSINLRNQYTLSEVCPHPQIGTIMGTVQFTDNFYMFDSGKGAFVFNDWLLNPRYYFREDSTQPFYELMCDGNRSRDDLVRFKHPHHEEIGEFRFQNNGDHLVMDGVIYKKKDSCPSEIEVVPFPIERGSRHLFRLSDGQFIYVSTVKNSYSAMYFLKSFRLYIGDGKTMCQVEITDLPEVYLDGGTTIIKTAEGVLKSPSGLRKQAATWKLRFKEEEELIELDPTLFRISETEEGVQISE